MPDPPVMLITDRHQAYHPIIDIITAAMDGGCRWISVREKDLPTGDQIELACMIADLGTPLGARVMIHGSPELAQDAGLDAVHLPASGDIIAARQCLGANAWISISTHGLDEIYQAAARGADAVTLSPIFMTPSKPGYGPAIGLDGLQAIVEKTSIPSIALGGLAARSAGGCLASGAAAIAVMGEIFRSPTPATVMADLISYTQTCS